MALPTRVNRGQQYDPYEYAQREFDTMLNRWFGGRGDSGGGTSGGGGMLAPYGVDVREDADHIYVEAELPGFRKDDVDITLENQTLTITAERREETGGNSGQQVQPGQQQPQGGKTGKGGQSQSRPQGDWLLRERRYTRFQRSFTLPPTVDESSCDARLNDGVLTITLNKREETKPRKIQVG